jgi:hypothetical protein
MDGNFILFYFFVRMGGNWIYKKNMIIMKKEKFVP